MTQGLRRLLRDIETPHGCDSDIFKLTVLAGLPSVPLQFATEALRKRNTLLSDIAETDWQAIAAGKWVSISPEARTRIEDAVFGTTDPRCTGGTE